jgi:hypothetical protein
MSTQPDATIVPGGERTEITTDSEPQLTEADDLVDDVSFQTLTCPADGTILEDAPQPEPGRYECPHCRRVLPIWEVYQQR